MERKQRRKCRKYEKITTKQGERKGKERKGRKERKKEAKK